MKLRIKLGFLFLALLYLCGCTAPSSLAEKSGTKFTRRETQIFDTEITFIAYAKTEDEFLRVHERTMDLLRELDHIFDAYTAYDDLHNLYYVNRHAAEEPVEIPQPLFELISWCKAAWENGHRDTNIAMGAVLSIWHDYRTAGIAHPESAQLPPMEELMRAREHTDFENVILDPEKSTVFFTDPALTLDIGAVAKGYAADKAAAFLKDVMPSFLLSLGGNVYAGEAPLDGRASWAVGVQDPRADALALSLGGTEILDVVDVNRLSVVTSGDYWRYYMVDGERYHHIIDPETLMPSRQVLSVTVVCESSILADFLSTTLFVLPFEDGLKAVEGLEGVEAMWVLPDGTIEASSGMDQYARKLKS